MRDDFWSVVGGYGVSVWFGLVWRIKSIKKWLNKIQVESMRWGWGGYGTFEVIHRMSQFSNEIGFIREKEKKKRNRKKRGEI